MEIEDAFLFKPRRWSFLWAKPSISVNLARANGFVNAYAKMCVICCVFLLLLRLQAAFNCQATYTFSTLRKFSVSRKKH
jgi:hypothetical protein